MAETDSALFKGLNDLMRMERDIPQRTELWGGMRFHKQWNWICDPYFWNLIPVAYLTTIFCLYQFMKFTNLNFDGPCLKRLMMVYNIVQVAFCSWMIYLFIPDFAHFPDIFGLYSEFTPRAEFAMIMHFFSKALDYFDTIFMILRRKERQLTFLHVFHHATVLQIWGCLLYASHGGSTAGFAAMLNSFVHVVMYSHYLITSFGIRNPFKKYITMVQLAQFMIDFVHAILILTGFGNYPKRLASIQFVYQIFMLTLFGNFYMKSYSKPSKVKPTAGPKITRKDSTGLSKKQK